jgi:hypothetical protein
MAPFRQRALTALAAAGGMTALPAIHWSLDEHGPASRVLFHGYLPPFGFAAIVVGGAVVGASLGAEAALHFRRSTPPFSVARVTVGCLGGGALAVLPGALVASALNHQLWGLGPLAMAALFGITGLGGWLGGLRLFRSQSQDPPPRSRRTPWWRLAALALLIAAIVNAQLDPFPSRGTVAERDAWARAHVREYPGLTRVVSRVPEVVGDIGRVTAIAPTAHDQHMFGREMNGDDMLFTLEVVGERGTGVFFADGTLANDWIVDWRSGSWTFGGKTTPIDPRDQGPKSAR